MLNFPKKDEADKPSQSELDRLESILQIEEEVKEQDTLDLLLTSLGELAMAKFKIEKGQLSDFLSTEEEEGRDRDDAYYNWWASQQSKKPKP